MGGTCDYGNDFRITSIWEAQVTTCTSTRDAFFPLLLSYLLRVTLDFGQDISFVALVIIGMISNLHLGVKDLLRPVRATWPKSPECRFFLCK